jgi:hypothetical protein
MSSPNTLQQLRNRIYRIALKILYYSVIFPSSLWAKKISDPLDIENKKLTTQNPSQWVKRSASDTSLADARRQY